MRIHPALCFAALAAVTSCLFACSSDAPAGPSAGGGGGSSSMSEGGSSAGGAGGGNAGGGNAGGGGAGGNVGGGVQASAHCLPNNGVGFRDQIIWTGQSFAEGYQASPGLSTTQPYQNTEGVGDALVALEEPLSERPLSPSLNMISHLAAQKNDLIGVLRAQGGASYAVLRAEGVYDASIEQTQQVNDIVEGLGEQHRVIAVNIWHGGSDNDGATTIAEYVGYLAEWQSDYDTDVSIITGQRFTVPAFVDQIGEWTFAGVAEARLWKAQLQAAEDNDNIYLIGPRYIYTRAEDNLHFDNESSRKHAELTGKVNHQVLIQCLDWEPLRPLATTVEDSSVTITYHVPCRVTQTCGAQPLEFDTRLVAARANRGFRYIDDASDAPEITDVTIEPCSAGTQCTVRIDLSGPPNLGARIGYADYGTPGATPGSAEGAAGNLRDSDSITGPSGQPLHNWAVVSELEL